MQQNHRGTAISAPPYLGRGRPEIHLGTRPDLFITPDQQIEDSGLPAPRWVGPQRPRRQGLTRLRPASAPVAGTAMSTLPGFIGLRPADAPEVESSIGHVSYLRAVRPARTSEAMTLRRRDTHMSR